MVFPCAPAAWIEAAIVAAKRGGGHRGAIGGNPDGIVTANRSGTVASLADSGVPGRKKNPSGKEGFGGAQITGGRAIRQRGPFDRGT
jgi:hypothetical protein